MSTEIIANYNIGDGILFLMQERIGIIYGDTTSTAFTFASNKDIKRLQYITVPHEEGDILAQVREVKKISKLSFENVFMENIKKEGDRNSATADVIGYLSGRGLRVPRTPFKPGEHVYPADEQLIRKVLGIKVTGAYIGLLRDTHIKTYLDCDTLIQKHLCILAKSGSGKSYVMGVICEELLKKTVPILIIDPHGEYTSLLHPNLDKNEFDLMKRFGVKPRGYGNAITQYSPDYHANPDALPLHLDEINLEFKDLLDVIPAKLSGVQKGILYHAVKEAKEKKRVYLLGDIIENIKKAKSSAKWNLIPLLEELTDMNLFSPDATPTESLVEKGKCSLINLRGVPPHIQEVVVSHVLTKIFEARKRNAISPLLVVIEEAHRYCPERGQGTAVSAEILRTLASEGRKFGIGLAIVSQRPARVEKNVLSQCNTQIILKTTNPHDVKAITSSVEGLTTGAANEIQRLPIGMAIVSGLPIHAPIFVEIRVRETRHGGKGAEVLEKENKPGGFFSIK